MFSQNVSSSISEETLIELCKRGDYEKVRKFYKPDKVRVLFIGFNPPKNRFFYCRNSVLYYAVFSAFSSVLNVSERDFLGFFKKSGCYLYDLFPEERVGLKKIKKKIKRREINVELAVKRLAKFLKEEKDNLRNIIVCFSLKNNRNAELKECIVKALKEVRFNIELEFFPFPGTSLNFARAVEELEKIISAKKYLFEV